MGDSPWTRPILLCLHLPNPRGPLVGQVRGGRVLRTVFLDTSYLVSISHVFFSPLLFNDQE